MAQIDIISGFLGAGKTTLIRKLLSEGALGDKVAIIENEFGEVGIDGGLLEETGAQVREIQSGCICCTLVGDFAVALTDIMKKYHPERIIIEPSGVGKLSEVISGARRAAMEEGVGIGTVITLVDAVRYRTYLQNYAEFYMDQIECARTIILTRTEEAGPEKVEAAIQRIRARNEQARIITTPLEQLTGQEIMDIAQNSKYLPIELQLEEELMREKQERERRAAKRGLTPVRVKMGKAHAHQHDADEVFGAWGKETARRYSKGTLEGILSAFADEARFGQVLRAKGVVPDEQGNWLQFDYVPGESGIQPAKPAASGRLCVIGAQLNAQALEDAFAGE